MIFSVKFVIFRPNLTNIGHKMSQLHRHVVIIMIIFGFPPYFAQK